MTVDTRLITTPAGNVEAIDVDAVGRELERLAVERYALTLRERVKALPASYDDGLWIQTQVIRMLDEVTTPSAGPRGTPEPAPVTAALSTSEPGRVPGETARGVG